MEVLSDIVFRSWNLYLYYFDMADPRVSDWPLMFAYWPTVILAVMYLAVVYLGKYIMEHRKPLSCYHVMLAYNLILVALNFHIFYEIAKALWWYYISKLIEFLDTIFFVVRKKNNQITFLHIYHHATMFPIWWIGVKWVPGGQSFFGAMINSFVHVVMYSYYCLSALGPKVQKHLWWKKYLTILQLVQFIAGLSHSAQSIYRGCPFPLWMQWALIFYGTSIFFLFINFYRHAYIKPQKDHRFCKEESKNKVMEQSNGKIKSTLDANYNNNLKNGKIHRRSTQDHCKNNMH